MLRRRLQDCQKAVELLQARTPTTRTTSTASASARAGLNAVMRIRTHFTLHITEMLDTPEHRKIWSQLRAGVVAREGGVSRGPTTPTRSRVRRRVLLLHERQGRAPRRRGRIKPWCLGNAVKLMKRFPSYDGGALLLNTWAPSI